jgi:hypothetical protein
MIYTVYVHYITCVLYVYYMYTSIYTSIYIVYTNLNILIYNINFSDIFTDYKVYASSGT